jgi:ketosteroid isomerase-like protein
MKRTFLQSAVILVLVLWSAGTIMAQKEKDDAFKDKIELINKQIAVSMVSGELDAEMAFYCKDAVSMPANEPMLDGIEAIRKASEDKLKAGWKVTAYEPQTLRVSSGGKYITEIGYYKIKVLGPGMSIPMVEEGKYLNVFEIQTDESLKIKIEIWNTDSNPLDFKKP